MVNGRSHNRQSLGKRGGHAQVQKAQCRLPAASWRGMERPMAQDDKLTRYRESIDNIDAALVFMLAERFKITQAVGEYKATTNLPPADPGREERQIERLRQLAKDANLDPDFTEKFLRFIIDEVIRHHERIRDGAA
jgi:chorismate mutase